VFHHLIHVAIIITRPSRAVGLALRWVYRYAGSFTMDAHWGE